MLSRCHQAARSQTSPRRQQQWTTDLEAISRVSSTSSVTNASDPSSSTSTLLAFRTFDPCFCLAPPRMTCVQAAIPDHCIVHVRHFHRYRRHHAGDERCSRTPALAYRRARRVHSTPLTRSQNLEPEARSRLRRRLVSPWMPVVCHEAARHHLSHPNRSCSRLRPSSSAVRTPPETHS